MADSEPAAKKLKQNEFPHSLITSTNDSVSNSALLKEANEALQESNRIHVRPIVDETKLGIELFVGNKIDEFHGLIKTRYADFIVHEIDPDGNMAKLSSLEAPEEQEPTITTSLSDFVDGKAIECMSEVNNGYLNEYKIDVTGLDKDTRTSLHHAIRSAFDRLESSTFSESEATKGKKNGCSNDKETKSAHTDSTQVAQQVDVDLDPKISEFEIKTTDSEVPPGDTIALDKKYIIVTRRSKISRAKNVWPRNRPDHTHFILYKENKDTMDAIHNLGAAINTRPSNFSYAGVKDRRAVTTQWISSWRLEPKRLIAACRRFNKRPYIKVGNFCFRKEPLRLGQLKANKFDIIIRHLVYNNEGIKVIEKSMNSIKDKGFVNYFGLQRFGTRSIQTHEIGLAVLQTKWDKAVDLILSYRFDDNMQPPANQEKSSDTLLSENDSNSQPQEVSESNRNTTDGKRWTNGAEQHNSFIDLWKFKLDAEVVFKKYPHYRFSNEGLIMKYLSKSEDSSRDYLNALISLPRNTRSMYVHSYQSLLWNKIATYRLKKYGFDVIPGDLILGSGANISDNSLDILLSADEVNTNDDTGAKSATGDAHDTGGTARRAPIEEIASEIEIATDKNLHKYTIFDVVLPIIGSRVKLPENDVGTELKRLLDNDNLTLESFRAREKLFISYGSYRKIMVKPNNVNWTIKQYSHPQQNLVETDLDILNREIMSKDKETTEKPVSPPKSDSSDEALMVEFELPPSSYATMCLREIMKKPSTDFNNRF